MALGVTGQRPVNLQTRALDDMLIVSEDDLSRPYFDVNQASQSGKQRGSIVLSEAEDKSLNIMVATGDQPDDPWVPLGGKNGKAYSAKELIDLVKFSEVSDTNIAVTYERSHLLAELVYDVSGLPQVVYTLRVLGRALLKVAGTSYTFTTAIDGFEGLNGQYFLFTQSNMMGTHELGDAVIFNPEQGGRTNSVVQNIHFLTEATAMTTVEFSQELVFTAPNIDLGFGVPFPDA